MSILDYFYIPKVPDILDEVGVIKWFLRYDDTCKKYWARFFKGKYKNKSIVQKVVNEILQELKINKNADLLERRIRVMSDEIVDKLMKSGLPMVKPDLYANLSSQEEAVGVTYFSILVAKSRILGYFLLKKYGIQFTADSEIRKDIINFDLDGEFKRDLVHSNMSIDHNKRYVAMFPHKAEPYYHRGNSYFFNGEYALAINDFARAIKLDPNYDSNKNLIFYRGESYLYMGNFNKAIDDFDRLIEISPNFVRYYEERAFAYANKGDYDKAIEDFSRAIELDPNDITRSLNHFFRAIAYTKKGEYNKAKADAKLAIEHGMDRAKELLDELNKL